MPMVVSHAISKKDLHDEERKAISMKNKPAGKSQEIKKEEAATKALRDSMLHQSTPSTTITPSSQKNQPPSKSTATATATDSALSLKKQKDAAQVKEKDNKQKDKKDKDDKNKDENGKKASVDGKKVKKEREEVSKNIVPIKKEIKEEPDDSVDSVKAVKRKAAEVTTDATEKIIAPPSKKQKGISKVSKSVIITGFYKGFVLDEKKFYQFIKSLKTKPVRVEKKSNDPLIVHVLCLSPEDAQIVVEKTNGVSYLGNTLHVHSLSDKKLEASRLIIRNLSFRCTEADIKEIMGKYGEITDLKFPLDPKTHKPKGYAFVQFSELKSAKKAVEKINGKDIKGRTVAVDFALPQDQFIQHTVLDQVMKSVKEEQDKEEQDKDKIKKEEQDDAETEDKSEDDDDEGDDDDDDDEGEVDNEDSSDSDSSDSDDSDSSESSGDENKKRMEQNRKDQRDELAKNMRTPSIFVRNLSFDTNEKDLQDFFKQFGPVRYCLLVRDKQTNLPKGSAFVRFHRFESAAKAVEAGKLAAPQTGEQALYFSAVGKPEMTIHGKHIIVDVAVDRDEVKLAKKHNNKVEKKDSRNKHLANEGKIKDTTGLTKKEAELVKQNDQLMENRLKNPNWHVSTTRLALQNVPFSVDEATLRDVFTRAAIGAKSEAPVIKQLKLMRDEVTHKSRGYGFIEFEDHLHALKALRTLNNNSSVPELNKKRMFISFALDSALKLRTLEKNAKRAAEKQTKKKKKEGAVGEDGQPVKTLKQIRKEKRERKKLRKIENKEIAEQKGVESTANEVAAKATLRKNDDEEISAKIRILDPEDVALAPVPNPSGGKKRKKPSSTGDLKTNIFGDGNEDNNNEEDNDGEPKSRTKKKFKR
eukprot:TRINITY_DN5944_c0_g2_i1.p1 TRINITY_DN5944_c0_g2~~TRINITY_DN5944_c0_g2_i1.p1  ORF type:complete len:883 (-),score=305.26 TRINITY_DN5944_c0_g2_i1:30-2630(-)